MKIVKTSIMAAVIALSASLAQAFDAPYYVLDGYIGTATIQSSGSCKFKETYVDAQWGQIVDVHGAPVGVGLISFDNELLAAYDTVTSAYISGYFSPGKSQNVSYYNLARSETVGKISALGGCEIIRLISSAKSKGTLNHDESKPDSFALTYFFNGISPAMLVTKGAKDTYKPQTFSGKITFKSTAPFVLTP